MDGFLDHSPELLLQHIADDAEGRDRRLVVGDVGLLQEVATGELVEIVTGIHAEIHVF